MSASGFAIVIAWPETICKQAGGWYDPVLSFLGLNKNGYYKVGHAAVVLIDSTELICHYFDFGRYHAPHGYGRVRSSNTDHDLSITTKPEIAGNKIVNLSEILIELAHNKSCHGDGTTYAAVTEINFLKAYNHALYFQDKEFLRYGPFVKPGTNCSRFVASVVRIAQPKWYIHAALRFPLTISPSPYWNVIAVSGWKKKVVIHSYTDEVKFNFSVNE